MSNNENYPEWGAFGNAEEARESKPNAADSGAGALVIEYIMSYSTDGMPTLTPEATDTEERLKFGDAELARERDRIMLMREKSKDEQFGAAQGTSSLSSITIERSNASAIDIAIDNVLRDVGENAKVGVVYGELVRLALTPNRPRPFTGPASVD
ncbi:MAG: hypothetical protein ACXW2U_16380 [Telluria sp.]